MADPLTVDPGVLKMWVDLDMVSEDALDSLPGAAQVAAALHSSGAAVAKGRIGRGRRWRMRLRRRRGLWLRRV